MADDAESAKVLPPEKRPSETKTVKPLASVSDPQEVFDVDVFRAEPEVFYAVAQLLYRFKGGGGGGPSDDDHDGSGDAALAPSLASPPA